MASSVTAAFRPRGIARSARPLPTLLAALAFGAAAQASAWAQAPTPGRVASWFGAHLMGR